MQASSSGVVGADEASGDDGPGGACVWASGGVGLGYNLLGTDSMVHLLVL
jgi:hypothetical protein